MRHSAKLLAWVLAAAVIGCGVSMPARAAGKIGVVLMHGKDGSASARGAIGPLIRKMKAAGLLVAAPDMPWSRRRFLAKDYDGSMREIDAAVARLKHEGATRIVVAGMSMGANAALGYGARRSGLAGIAAIAPGHVPELAGFQRRIHNDYRRAKAMVDAGKGNAFGSFLDINQGRTKHVRVKARIYLSWFDPHGPAVIPKNAAHLKPGTPLLWVVGRRDRMYARGKAYAFARAPANPKSAYIVVRGGHMKTPTFAADRIVRWVKGL